MTQSNNHSNSVTNDKRLIGLLAQFEDPATLVNACDQARQAGYKRMDAYSPFPIHGIDPVMGIKRTILPFIVLAVGLGACAVGLGMQWYANNDTSIFGFFPGYPFKISGKPYFSIPANIPVTFEVIVLSSAFAAFLGMWALNGLPRFANPLLRISRFKRVTNDRFFLMIETKDGQFDRERTENELNAWGASFIEECNEDMTDQQLPAWVRTAGVLVAFLCLLPPVIIFRMSGMTNREPRMHIIPDMDWQDKNKTQTLSPNFAASGEPDYLFADGRVMRPPISGTIARGQLFTDIEYYQGIQAGSTTVAAVAKSGSFTSLQDDAIDAAAVKAAQDAAAKALEPKWITTFPDQLVVDQTLLARGQQRFEIYCSVCHGYAGNGDGLVNQRALALAATGNAAWTTAKSLHDPVVKDDAQNPIGRIFDTISNGRSSMGPYKDQISVEDRWAIVAYVKALQATGIEPVNPAVAAEGDAKAVPESTKP